MCRLLPTPSLPPPPPSSLFCSCVYGVSRVGVVAKFYDLEVKQLR